MTAVRPKPPSAEVAIIRTRLAPPRIGSAPVSRDKLLQRLDMHRSRKMTLVLGPAGSVSDTAGAEMIFTSKRPHTLADTLMPFFGGRVPA